MSSTPNQLYTCTLCHQKFAPTSNEAVFNASQDYPDMLCPACQDMKTHKRGSGRDQEQSAVQYGPCPVCGSQTEYFPMTKGQHTVYCPQCSRSYSSSSY